MADSSNSNSCVETPAAPEWLSKLENRREKLARCKPKLGHEAGAGAPCNECGDKCPGLDLHFWRKVCRNCKCRKDQHMCVDDDLSGWAQFEILGQIRSKPAYIKIKALASQPVQVEWVPPNAAPDVISDYMDKLGTTQIPVAGSDAAHKRKQQLEFQVPPHDLDATLCDNLTETEAQQLAQYVQKLREQCVGQGTVVRIGGVGVTHGIVGYVPRESVVTPASAFTPAYVQLMQSLGEAPVADAVLSELITSPKLATAIASPKAESSLPRLFMAFSEPISHSVAEFEQLRQLTPDTKEKLLGLNIATVQSLVQHGPIYDKMLADLKHKNMNIARDPKLGPIAEFRREYLTNPKFKAEIDAVCESLAPNKSQQATPLKSRQPLGTPFNSPLPLKQASQARFGAQMRQDTPMRKVKFGGVTTVVYECGLPPNVDYEKDPVFAQIVHSEPLKQALQNAREEHAGRQSIIVSNALPAADVASLSALDANTKAQVQAVGLDTHMLRSAVANTPYYERLYQALNDKDIDYKDCKLLAPMKEMNNWLLNDQELLDDLDKVFAQMASNADVKYATTPLLSVAGGVSNSQSNDSGFYSKPSTPNYGNYPGEELNAALGRFAAIPGIEDMNMYPSCAASVGLAGIPQALQQLQLTGGAGTAATPAAAVMPPVLDCRDCAQPIGFGEVAVKAERAGKEIAWHPACFKCHTCRELLADLVYFFHHGQVYCGRDLAIKLKIPRCKACDELIFTKEYTAAESSTFHIKHFCCYQCDTPLAGQQYIPDEKSNMPLCLKCYDEFFAAACQYCAQQIGPADQGVAWGDIHWHGQCFVCAGAQCNKSLIGGRFCVKQNMPFCSPACVRSIIN